MSGITKAVSLRSHIIWLNQLRILMNFLLSIAGRTLQVRIRKNETAVNKTYLINLRHLTAPTELKKVSHELCDCEGKRQRKVVLFYVIYLFFSLMTVTRKNLTMSQDIKILGKWTWSVAGLHSITAGETMDLCCILQENATWWIHLSLFLLIVNWLECAQFTCLKRKQSNEMTKT